MRSLALGHTLSIGAAAALLGGCGGSQPPIGALPQGQTVASTTRVERGGSWTLPEAQRRKIKHVVIIVQMDRSFNNLFYGYPGAKTSKYGRISTGEKIELQPVTIATTWDLQHNAQAFYEACNGTGKIPGAHCRMNGFNNETWTCNAPGRPKCPIKYPPYAYVPHGQIRPYFDMAKQYVLADEMNASNFDAGSFESLQYIIEAQDHATVGGASGVPGCGGGPHDWIETIGGGRIHPCFTNPTLGDELDAARLSWAYYEDGGTDGICGNGGNRDDHGSGYGLWIAYWAIKHICYGPEWNSDVISPPRRFLTDVKNGELRTVSWVTPRYSDSDHPGNGSDTGPSWVASLVNAVGESKYWSSTAIFIFWDSYGGWYDPEAPPYLDNDGLGFRIPLLIISPYAKKGYVSHVHYEHGSILKFTEDQFKLARLAASDMRANSPERDCFDFNQAPRKFVPIKAPYDAN
jgi:phospholipase C